MKKLFFKPLLPITLISLLMHTHNALAENKLVVWATIDQPISNKKTITELSSFLEKNHPDILKNISITDTHAPHITIAVGIIKEENGKKYVVKKGKKVLLETAINTIDKAISNNKINHVYFTPEFNLKAGSRFSDPINDTHFYIMQQPTFNKNHQLHKLGTAITKELSNIGLKTGTFDPRVSSTLISSNDQKSINQLQYLQNAPKLWKIIQVPASSGLNCSKVQVLINKGNNYETIKTYDLKK